MDMDKFMEKLSQRLDSVLMTAENNDLSTTAIGFNNGARTMYNYALVVAYEMQSEMKEAV